MKNRYFSIKMFFQGLRLIRLPGLILLISTLVFSLLQAISQLFSINKIHMSDSLINSQYSYLYLSIPAIVTIFATVAPLILTLSAFSFLRKRRASDFYHSIPVNRICLFLSYTLSIITWTFAIILIGALASSSVYLIGGALSLKSITLQYLLSIVKLLVGSLSVIACTLLVMSITSNLFSTLFMTAVLLYLPKTVFSLYTICLASSVGNIISLPNTGMTSVLSLLGYPFYSSSALRYMYLSDGMTAMASTSVWSTILSQMVLTIVYFALGLLLFVRRKSEMAGHGASAPLLQHICRVAVTLPFIAYFPIAFLSKSYFNLFALITLVILAFIVYFSYEIIMTRRFASVLKAAPVFLVVVGIAALGSLGLYGVRYNILSFSPDPKQVKSIQVTLDSYPYYNTYNFSPTSNVVIKDVEAKKIVCNALKWNLYNFLTEKKSSSGYSYEYESTQRIEVKFNTGLFSKTRSISLSKNDVNDLILKCSQSNEEFKKAMSAMPNDKEITDVRFSSSNASAEKTDALELFKIYRDECKGLSIEKLLTLRNQFNSDTNVLGEGEFLVSGRNSNGSFSANYFLSGSLTPKTCAAVNVLKLKNTLKDLQGVLDHLDNRSVSFNMTNTTNYIDFDYNGKSNSGLMHLTSSDYNTVKKLLYDALNRAMKNNSGLRNEWMITVYTNNNEKNISMNLNFTESEIKALAHIANRDALNDLKKRIERADEYGLVFYISKQSNNDLYFTYDSETEGSSVTLTKNGLGKVSKILYKAFERPVGNYGNDNNYWSLTIYPRDASAPEQSTFSACLYFTDNDINFFKNLNEKF